MASSPTHQSQPLRSASSSSLDSAAELLIPDHKEIPMVYLNGSNAGLGSPWSASPKHAQPKWAAALKSRRVLWLVLVALGTAGYLTLGTDKRSELIETIKAKAPLPLTKTVRPPVFAPATKLIKPKPIKYNTPQTKFRDNLLDGHRYIYANHAYGLSNQFLELCKVVTMGYRMDRTPIFDNMHPEHGEGSTPRVSDLFDFNPAMNHLNLSLVEFAELKTTDPDLAGEEELSGYAAFADYVLKEGLEPYAIKTNFWPIPPAMYYYPTMTTIELLGQRPPWDWIEANAERIWAEQELPVPPTPDETVLTLDQAFYVREARFREDGSVFFNESLEHIDADSFIWQGVGQHVRFQPWVERLADDFLAALFGRSAGAEGVQGAVPSAPAAGAFIGVHIRQGDFSLSDRAPGHEDLPVAFHGAVLDLQDELAERFADGSGGHLPVLFATDSDDRAWIAKVEEAYGWVYLDHAAWDGEKGHEFEGWVPGMLDSCVLGRGIGMVGTHMSTFSSVAARRVESWQGGITRKVDFKNPEGGN